MRVSPTPQDNSISPIDYHLHSPQTIPQIIHNLNTMATKYPTIAPNLKAFASSLQQWNYNSTDAIPGYAVELVTSFLQIQGTSQIPSQNLMGLTQGELTYFNSHIANSSFLNTSQDFPPSISFQDKENLLSITAGLLTKLPTSQSSPLYLPPALSNLLTNLSLCFNKAGGLLNVPQTIKNQWTSTAMSTEWADLEGNNLQQAINMLLSDMTIDYPLPPTSTA
jgi:hypothetical protein